MMAWSFAQTGGQTGLNTLATLGYPPEMRSSGMGWASGVGPASAASLFPLAGGMALGAALPLRIADAADRACRACSSALLIAVLGVGVKRQAAAGRELRRRLTPHVSATPGRRRITVQLELHADGVAAAEHVVERGLYCVA